MIFNTAYFIVIVVLLVFFVLKLFIPLNVYFYVLCLSSHARRPPNIVCHPQLLYCVCDLSAAAKVFHLVLKYIEHPRIGEVKLIACAWSTRHMPVCAKCKYSR